MKKLNALLGISLSLLLTGNAIAQDFKSGEVIVKFKSNSVFANAVGASGQNQPQVVAVEDTASAIAELSQRSDVEYVEPNYIVTAEALPTRRPTTGPTPAQPGPTSTCPKPTP